MKSKLLFISLNEINFDLIKGYLSDPRLKNFRTLSEKIKKTECKEEYKNLEPWIQWPTIYTGKTASQHKQYRLGDSINFNHSTIFNDIENLGVKVGAISPMNISNNLNAPSYFIPDPWTDTLPDKNYWSKTISKTISYFVKSNSDIKFNLKYLFLLKIIFLKFFKITNIFLYLKLFFTSFRCKWRKALFLDLLLSDIHNSFFKKNNPDFSNLFLNGFAHIQHHYMFNSKENPNKNLNPEWYLSSKYDPIKEALLVYEKILDEYLNKENFEVIIATGLTQIPYDRTKFYYKLTNHQSFFQKFEINFESVQELMSRDFYLFFKDSEEAKKALEKIKKITDENNKNFFGDFQLKDNRLFLSLTYDLEIFDQVIKHRENIKIFDYVNFVALKNGMHSSQGFIYTSYSSKILDFMDISNIREIIYEFFNNKKFAEK